MKIALVSESLPPSATGQGMLIYRMLERLDPESYCLISTVPQDSDGARARYARKLPGRYYHMAEGFRLTRGYRFGLPWIREAINFPLAVVQQARQITEIVKHEGCNAVVAFSGDVTHLPAAWLASRRTGVPFFAYVVDHYSHREWVSPAAAVWARRLEPFLMKKADRVIVLNEALRDDLRERFGVEAAVIYNSFDLSPYERAIEEQVEPVDGVKIVFTGDVYEAHYDAFRNLLMAIERLERPDVKIHVYTSRSVDQLAEKGLCGPIVCHEPLALEEMPRVQREADILFLPLAFDSPYPGVIRTSAPTKMGEYLAARRPILVHAPADSFIAGYFRHHECGVVVDQLDPSALAQAIERVLDDADLRQRLSARAWDRARDDFSIDVAREKFMSLLEHRPAAGLEPGVRECNSVG
jgi:glycosyltransferase involved in cell wall biosynthesis